MAFRTVHGQIICLLLNSFIPKTNRNKYVAVREITVIVVLLERVDEA